MRRAEAAATSPKPRLRDQVAGVIMLLLIVTLGVHVLWPPASAPAKAPAPANPAATDRTPLLGVKGGDPVHVWLDDDAMNRAFLMLKQGVQNTHPELIDALVACTVAGGTKVIEQAGIFSVDVEVTDGPAAGCQGTVESSELHDGH